MDNALSQSVYGADSNDVRTNFYGTIVAAGYPGNFSRSLESTKRSNPFIINILLYLQMDHRTSFFSFAISVCF